MPTAVRCVVESDEPVPLIRLVGHLDPAAAMSIRGELLGRLADRADAVVVDLSELIVEEPAALSVLSSGVDEAADWAPGQLVLCGSPAGPAGRASGETLSESIDAALVRLNGTDAPPVLSVVFEPVVEAARQARQLVSEGCARWSLPAVAGPACIAVTELVNNVVAHARTPMIVRVTLGDDALHVAVRDHCPDQPTFRGPVAAGATGGRGLLLIDALAQRWGTTALDDGKVVWAVLGPDDESD